LRVAIPAMMLGHLTFAGLAEAVISAGMVSYLQRSDVALLRQATWASVDAGNSIPRGGTGNRRLWWAVGILLLCTPLGILAAGTAWGEWSTADLSQDHSRREIAAVSSHHPPPTSVPPGLQRFSSVWTAPFPGYAPGFIKNPFLGYLLSGMFAVGLFVMTSLIARAIGRKWSRREASS